MRQILEAYYEPQFSEHSHGFRPNRGCHTALQEIQVWKGTRWFIEGDISQYFDTIDHKILLEILARNIHDGRFIRLVSNMLEAGLGRMEIQSDNQRCASGRSYQSDTG